MAILVENGYLFSPQGEWIGCDGEMAKSFRVVGEHVGYVEQGWPGSAKTRRWTIGPAPHRHRAPTPDACMPVNVPLRPIIGRA